MSGSITLSASMRANLLSLQNTSKLQATTQGRLATGKKVNSALDNPTSFFAAQSLSDRANDLSNLLDGMGQAIQTITAATQGITAGISIINQMQSVAQSAATAVGTGAGAGSGTNVVAYTAQGTTGAGTAISATVAGTQNLVSLGSTTSGSSLNIQNGDTMTVQVGTGTTYTFTVGATNVNNGTLGNGGGSTLKDLTTWLGTVDAGNAVSYGGGTGALFFGANASKVTIAGTLASDLGLTQTNTAAAFSSSKKMMTVAYSGLAGATGSNLLSELTNSTGGDLVSNVANTGGTTVGNYLTIAVGGGQAKSINITATMTVQDLMDSINSIGGLSASLDSAGKLKVVNNNSTAVTIGGTANGLLNAATSIAANGSVSTTLYHGYGQVAAGSLTATNLVNLQPPSGQNRLASGDLLSVTLGGVTTNITVTGSGAGSATTATTVTDLLASLGQVSGITASLDATTGALNITASGGQAVTIAGTAATKLNLAGTIAAGQSNQTSTLATFAKQYDDLRTQLNQLVSDSSYQGVNLIDGSGGSLNVKFNNAASNANALTITGTDLSTTGLSLTAATGAWKGASSVSTSQTALTNAIGTLRSQSAALGQNLTTVQTRQDFTTNLINTLQTGAGNLTNADMNTESANMLALQTQQQLGISSLSLASQASQGILKLFP